MPYLYGSATWHGSFLNGMMQHQESCCCKANVKNSGMGLGKLQNADAARFRTPTGHTGPRFCQYHCAAKQQQAPIIWLQTRSKMA